MSAQLIDSARALATTRARQVQETAAKSGIIDFAANTVKILTEVCLASDFAFERLLHQPEWINDFTRPAGFSECASLSEFRVRRSIAQIALECSGKFSVEQSLEFASETAKICIQAALSQAESETHTRFGELRSDAGERVQLVVFAMGKLGGGELNFSSDIDLIMSFARQGNSDGARGVDADEYFARITRRTAQLLSETNEYGAAYRVDLRLRPFGSAGQAALSFAAMEDYYQREGRDWERYAWIKAQPVAGDIAAGMQLKEILRPFVFRKYLDFSAFEGMREMKALIDAEVRKTERYDHLKLGPGGIREIEFLIQLEQLIRGGRDASLRISSSLEAIWALTAAGFWQADDAAALRAHYLFLRAVENRVQMLADQQTHTLPEDNETRARIAASLGFNSLDAFLQKLQDVRSAVHQRFTESVALPREQRMQDATLSDAPSLELDDARMMWETLTGPNADEAQKPDGIGVELWQALQGFALSASVQSLSARGRKRLNEVVPLLWSLAQTHCSAESLEPCALDLLQFLQAIVGRTAYLALLAEKPHVADRLVALFASSRWLAAKMTRTPMLLDELLDQRRLLEKNDAQTLARELALATKEFEHDDLELQYEALISAQHAVQFRIAVGFLHGRITALTAVQQLSDLADVILRKVLSSCYEELCALHGPPVLSGDDLIASCVARGLDTCGIALVAYGSLGGKELNFASDLDLVFIYNSDQAERDTCAGSKQKAIDGQKFFVKLAQRMISRLTTATRFGSLYATDTRLRPNGNKGLLVTSFSAFEHYQRFDAWMWEHQALVRARSVSGDRDLCAQFERLRLEILRTERDGEQVSAEVAKMRDRMRRELDRSDAQRFDLKQGEGGLVDIEFGLQSAVLRSGLSAPSSSQSCDLLAHFSELQPEVFSDATGRHQELLRLSLHATLRLQARVVARSAIVKR
jgi:[glutamine synthetase] adenylyltransferase / [glutamine synthetase]-adenylyl-L-tyrosine phosphorylase